MIGPIVSAVIVLLVVIGMYMAVSYKHDKSGLGKGCDGNCASCAMSKATKNACKSEDADKQA